MNGSPSLEQLGQFLEVLIGGLLSGVLYSAWSRSASC